MPAVTTRDGVEIYYKDWGSGQPIVFSHGWPLSADDWDAQMLFFLNHGGLKKINVPVLVMHSEDDQIVPYVAAGPLSAKLLKHSTFKSYKDLPHGMPTTHADTINADLLAFIKG
jgi:pimeloyl-ACP methyl ester carboxylesterase